MISVHYLGSGPALGELSGFRREFHRCLTRRADGLFELVDAVLCADGPVRTLVGLSLAPEHRRGHGGLYDAVNNGRIDPDRLRDVLAGLPLPRAADGRLVLAVDVSPWLRRRCATSQGDELDAVELGRWQKKRLGYAPAVQALEWAAKRFEDPTPPVPERIQLRDGLPAAKAVLDAVS